MKVEMISISEINLDLKNPRISRLVDMYEQDKITSELIAMALGAGSTEEGDTYATFKNLKESIKTNSGIIHPIIVNRHSNNEMTVIEGNTRLQIYREFLQEKTKGDWKNIPCIVHENLSQTEIDAIRLQSHLVGPRPWDPYSKARYLHLLSNEKLLTINQIVEFCGGKRKQVMDYIQAYVDMETFYRKALENEEYFDPTRFSAFVELQRPRIHSCLATHGYTKEDFAKWVINGLFHPLETVRSLPEILSDPEAKKVFFEDGASSARMILNKLSEEKSANLNEVNLIDLSNEVVRKLLDISHSEWKKMESNEDNPLRKTLLGLQWQLKDTLAGISEELDA